MPAGGAAGDDPEAGGGERPLGIPTIRDRVVQTAAKLVLGPIFEADFEDSAYGYRPGRGGADAIKEVHRLHVPGLHRRGRCRSVEILRHDPAPGAAAIGRPADCRPAVLWLIKLWLKAPIEERDGKGKRRMSGGKGSTCGTPQGGVASPLLPTFT